jgi:hypothetical protein
VRSRTDFSKMPSGHLGGRGIAQILVHGPFEIVYIFSRQFVASQYFRKITNCDPVKLIILWLKANYPHSVADFSKILGRHELSRKHIHDFKRPMNQNLGYPSAAQMSARHYRKIGSRAHASRESGLVILWLKPIINNQLQIFLKYYGTTNCREKYTRFKTTHEPKSGLSLCRPNVR